MLDLKDIKVDAKIKLFYYEGNINNEIIHIRAIVDKKYIAYKVWRKHKRRWDYKIENLIYFKYNKTYMTVVN